jgi:hypothetical protein
MAKSFRARVRLEGAGSQDVIVEADNSLNAKAILESQYGEGSVFEGPMEMAEEIRDKAKSTKSSDSSARLPIKSIGDLKRAAGKIWN